MEVGDAVKEYWRSGRDGSALEDGPFERVNWTENGIEWLFGI